MVHLRWRLLLAVLLIVFSAVFIRVRMQGQVPHMSGPILAQVGHNSLYNSDLESSLDGLAFAHAGADDAEQMRQEALDQLVMQEIFLQEAQRQGLDHNAQFMKTIEKYWKHTLVKTLTENKQREIMDQIKVTSQDIEQFYAKYAYSYSVKIVRAKSAQDLLVLQKRQDVLEDKELAGPEVVIDYGWQIMAFEDLYLRFGDSVEGREQQVFLYQDAFNKDYFLVALKDRTSVEKARLEDVRDVLENRIRYYRGRAMYQQWFESLREQAKVVMKEGMVYGGSGVGPKA